MANNEDFGDFEDLSEAEIIDETLTLDELLKDDYYKAEFEKRVQQRLEDINNHSTGGEQPMDDQVQIPEGESKQGEVIKQTPTPGGQPVLNDFEAKVQAMRKARGYK